MGFLEQILSAECREAAMALDEGTMPKVCLCKGTWYVDVTRVCDALQVTLCTTCGGVSREER